ncbi:MAG: hypothetical protein GJ680_16620 [Alteromonadaceae bacterium]|nr:hypothetical protein [Alteromonadaceae bacterium]
MSNFDKETIFNKWLDQELTSAEQAQFETWCKEDKDFADKIATMSALESFGQDFKDIDVPKWRPEDIFEKPAKTPWWQWSGLPTLSFATSMAAILMVTLRIEFTVGDGVLQVRFADSVDEQKIEQLVAARISEYETQQDQKFAQQTTDLQQQQLQMNTQLANYLLSTSRTERREDFAELIKHVNEQRSDDQVFYARQLNKIQQDFVANSEPAEWQPASMTKPVSGNE